MQFARSPKKRQRIEKGECSRGSQLIPWFLRHTPLSSPTTNRPSKSRGVRSRNTRRTAAGITAQEIMDVRKRFITSAITIFLAAIAEAILSNRQVREGEAAITNTQSACAPQTRTEDRKFCNVIVTLRHLPPPLLRRHDVGWLKLSLRLR